jgi:uncharacterized protein
MMASQAQAAGASTTNESISAAPVALRIEALDVVRGVALFGILLMNITGFGLAQAYTNPTNDGGATGANLWSWIITQMFFEGTQRGLFSLLFGASIILFTSRLEAAGRSDSADIYFRRNLWLIGFGFVNAFIFMWYGDILYAYGIVALFVFAFRKMAAKGLIAIGVGTLFLGALWNLYDTSRLLDKHHAYSEAVAARSTGATLNQTQNAAVAAWEEARGEFKATPQQVQEDVAERTGGLASAFLQISRINAYWQSWGMYRYFFDIFGMIMIGMALYKLGVLTLEHPARIYALMAAGGYSVGLTVNYLETKWILDHQFSAVAFAQTNVTYDLGRLAMTLGHLGILLLFVGSGILPWLRRSLAAVGQMAVTNYLMHSVICSFIFIGLGYFSQLERHQLYYIVFAIWALQLIVSPLWLRHYRFGPVEWLWRYLTYMTRPPMRHTAVPVTAGAAAAA